MHIHAYDVRVRTVKIKPIHAKLILFELKVADLRKLKNKLIIFNYNLTWYFRIYKLIYRHAKIYKAKIISESTRMDLGLSYVLFYLIISRHKYILISYFISCARSCVEPTNCSTINPPPIYINITSGQVISPIPRKYW